MMTTETTDARRSRIWRAIVVVLGVYAAVMYGAVLLVLLKGGFDKDARARAVIRMGLSFQFLWIVVCGLFMYAKREAIVSAVRALPGKWQIKFVIFATSLALLEEAITVAMTNLAPFFGSAVGQAYITASANYLHVVLLNSVVLFFPMFIFWSWWLTRYDFKPPETLALYGMTGVLMEALAANNPAGLLNASWIFVYGLFVWLPARTVPPRAATTPRWWHCLLAFVLPFPSMMPTAAIAALFKHLLHVHFFTDPLVTHALLAMC
jgi:hypothetical protein